jgi:glutathione S-transferase
MDLWYTTTSPFARKVRIAAAELGLAERLTLIAVNPWTDARLRAINPLAKVPTLALGNGDVLFESAVICDYLDALGPERRLFPADGAGRWEALLLHGLADGAMTAAGRLFADERRPADERAPAMLLRFAAARDATLDRLEQAALADAPRIGEVAVAALLGYLDFRWPDRDWRAGRPRLSAWFDRFADRPSMTTTRHIA